MAAAIYGGYDYAFVDQDLDEFICNICKKVFKNPHLTGCCGQYFCESCLNYWLLPKESTCTSVNRHRAWIQKKICPHCRAEGEDFQHLIDRRFMRKIDVLKIHCTNKEEGCQWIGELGSLKDHLESANGCGYVDVKCTNSGCISNNLKRKDLSNHLQNVCCHRPYQCDHCVFKGTYLATKSHYEKCPGFPLECPNKCGKKGIKRKDMKDHRSQCPDEWVECTYRCRHEHPGRRTVSFSTVPLTKRMMRRNLANHLKDECQLRPHQCEHCGLKGKYTFITIEHSEKCLDFPMPCPNKCGKNNVKRKDMEVHHSQCPREPVQCPFEEAGCKEKLVRRELERHMSANQQQHLLLVMGAYKEMKKELETMKLNRGW